MKTRLWMNYLKARISKMICPKGQNQISCPRARVLKDGCPEAKMIVGVKTCINEFKVFI